jgi:hypothetical protein
VCLACARLWAQSPAPKKKKGVGKEEGRNKEDSIHIHPMKYEMEMRMKEKIGMVAHTYNLSTWEVEVRSQHGLHSKLKTSIGYIFRLFVSKKATATTTKEF